MILFSFLSSQDNPLLKPLCLLYSCADERTGAGGHFSALVHTEGMWPEVRAALSIAKLLLLPDYSLTSLLFLLAQPAMVPLQQYDGFNPSEAPSLTPCVHRPQQLPLHPLPLLPLRFLLPKEMDLASHYLNKHMRVIQTHTGSWFAEYQQNRTMNYVKEVSRENHQEAEAGGRCSAGGRIGSLAIGLSLRSSLDALCIQPCRAGNSSSMSQVITGVD